MIIDGAVRDSLEIDEMDFPVFSVGTNPNGPTKNVAGRIGHPVSCGGVTVRSGDLVVADADGIVVVERDRASACCRWPARRWPTRPRASPRSAGQHRASWLAGALRAAGVLKEGETL